MPAAVRACSQTVFPSGQARVKMLSKVKRPLSNDWLMKVQASLVEVEPDFNAVLALVQTEVVLQRVGVLRRIPHEEA